MKVYQFNINYVKLIVSHNDNIWLITQNFENYNILTYLRLYRNSFLLIYQYNSHLVDLLNRFISNQMF